MHRRIAALVGLVAVLVLGVPTAALAAEATLRGPADGVVSGATSLDIRITREPFEAITAIEVTLRRGGATVQGSEAIQLCDGLRGCASPERTSDHRLPFDPRTGAPFLPDADARILPNGSYEVLVSIESGRDRQQRSLPLVLSVAPSSVQDVRATSGEGEVAVGWSRAPEPDVAGYRVERAAQGGDWAAAGELGASASSFVDGPAPGSYRYRVVTLRPDGKGGTYEVTSAEVTATVAASPAVADPAEDGPPDGAGDADRSVDGGSEPIEGEGAGSGGTGQDGLEGPAAGAGPSAGAGSSSQTSGSQAGAPSFATEGPGTPEAPAGDADVFEETLDYDDVAVAAPQPQPADGGEPEEVRLAVPGARNVLDGFDGERAAVPIAGGLLMTTIGLHLWRWLKVPMP